MSANDGEQRTRVVVSPPPPRIPPAMNVMDAYLVSLQRQERELSVNLRGRAARDYARGLSGGGSAAGEENEMASPWTFVSLSELIVPQPPAVDQPAAQADHSVEEAAAAAAAQADHSIELPGAAQADHSVEEAALAPATAVRAEICRSCRRWTAATPQVPVRHICLCVPCRLNPSARICCSVCSAGRRIPSTGRP